MPRCTPLCPRLPGRLYGLVKDHAAKEKLSHGGRLPPLCPAESASGTTFENVSHYVDMCSNHLVKNLPSYWEDTPDMLRCFNQQNELGPQPQGTIPVTLDVTALCTNMPLNQGISVMKEFLEWREYKSVATSFLVSLLKLILTCNILVFDGIYYMQRIGSAMGTRVAPTLACLFMGAMETAMLAGWIGL